MWNIMVLVCHGFDPVLKKYINFGVKMRIGFLSKSCMIRGYSEYLRVFSLIIICWCLQEIDTKTIYTKTKHGGQWGSMLVRAASLKVNKSGFCCRIKRQLGGQESDRRVNWVFIYIFYLLYVTKNCIVSILTPKSGCWGIDGYTTKELEAPKEWGGMFFPC